MNLFFCPGCSIDGHVRAGGLGLVGACDIVLTGPASTFAFTEARLGLAPAMISLTTLPRLDPRAASRYYLTGETFDAPTAARIGLVTEAVDDIGRDRVGGVPPGTSSLPTRASCQVRTSFGR